MSFIETEIMIKKLRSVPSFALERGYYFSINQQMVRSISGKRIIDTIPVDKILIESDAPFTHGLRDRYDLFFAHEIYAYLAKTRNLLIRRYF